MKNKSSNNFLINLQFTPSRSSSKLQQILCITLQTFVFVYILMRTFIYSLSYLLILLSDKLLRKKAQFFLHCRHFFFAHFERNFARLTERMLVDESILTGCHDLSSLVEVASDQANFPVQTWDRLLDILLENIPRVPP